MLQVSDEAKSYVLLSYDLYVWHVTAMVPTERRKHVAQAFNALSEAMSAPVVSLKQPIEIIGVFRSIVKWARDDPRDSELLELYDSLTAVSKSYADKLSNLRRRVELSR